MTTALSTDDLAQLDHLPPPLAERMRAALTALADEAPAAPVIAPDAYPGLKVTRAPARTTDAADAIEQIFADAGYPDGPIGLPGALAPVHRALAELVATRPGLSLGRFAIPESAAARQRWLGRAAPGALDREVDYAIGGAARRGPLWLALIELEMAGDADDGDPDATTAAARALLDALAPVDRLDADADLLLEVYRVSGPPREDFDPASVTAAAGPWAAAMAERLTALFAPGAPSTERAGHSEPPYPLPWMVFLGLARGGVTIEPRWDWLCPVSLELADATETCLAALPAGRRDAAVVRAIADMFPGEALRAGAALIARHPSAALLEHLLARADTAMESLMCPPRRTYVPALAASLADHPALVARIDAYLAALPPLPPLRVRSARYVTSVAELTPGQRTMLGVLGQGWEGDAGPLAWEGDDGAIEFGPLSYVSAFELEDDTGADAFEALLYMDEDGAVCVTNTTNSVAYVSQMGLSCNRGDALHEALHALLRERPPSADGDA